MKIKRVLSYDDVLIIPADCTNVLSRKDPDTRTRFSRGGSHDVHPIIASPMSTVCDSRMIIELNRLGCTGILHRGTPYTNQCQRLEAVKWIIDHENADNPTIDFGVAIGCQAHDFEHALELDDHGVRIICVDVANGHNKRVIDFISKLKPQLSSHTHLMAGNVATGKGYKYLADAGADSVRAGIGGGHACTTRINTGVGVPTLQSVIDCAETRDIYDLEAQIIADGGCDNAGDVAKALAAGADFVLAGSLFAGTDEAPGDIKWYNTATHKASTLRVGENGNWIQVKEYKGMASFAVQLEQGKDGKDVIPEGVSTYVKYKGPAEETVKLLLGGLRSAMSYCNALTLNEFRAQATLIEITNGGLMESKPRSVYNLRND